MIASIDNTTGLIIESQSNPRAGTLIQNALEYGYTDVSEIEVTEQDLNELIKKRDEATAPKLSKKELNLQAIAKLELSVTNRRLREATLGTDNGWLKEVESKIKLLRDKL